MPGAKRAALTRNPESSSSLIDYKSQPSVYVVGIFETGECAANLDRNQLYPFALLRPYIRFPAWKRNVDFRLRKLARAKKLPREIAKLVSRERDDFRISRMCFVENNHRWAVVCQTIFEDSQRVISKTLFLLNSEEDESTRRTSCS